MFPDNKSRIQVILVGGIGGEILGLPFVGSYMHCLKPIVRDLLPNSRVFVIQPKIYQSVQKTAADISMIVRDGFFFHGLRSIVIGHSRGGLEVLLAAIQNPDLIRLEMIQGIVAMNAPFRGSPVADMLCRWFGQLGLQWQALREMSTLQNSIQALEQVYSDEPELREKLLERSIFVQCESGPADTLCLPLKVSRPIVNRFDVKNDGLVPVSHQVPDWAGARRLSLGGHHGYFTCTGLLSKSTDLEKKQALEQCISAVADISNLSALYSEGKRVKKQLRVATYNVGMLKIPIWGVPYPNTRWRAICEKLPKMDYDVIFFQELFGIEARAELEKQFEDFYVIKGPDRPMSGLVTLVRKSLLRSKADVSFQYKPFRKQRRWESRVGFEKGCLTCHLKLPELESPLTLLNIHLTAFASAWKLRRIQRLEILEHCYSLDAEGLAENVILGGDFNDALRWPWATEDPTFSVNGELHRLKSILNREKTSMRLDYLIAFSKFKSEGIVYEDVGIDLADETVEIERWKTKLRIELSDHHLVRSNFKITEGRFSSGSPN